MNSLQDPESSWQDAHTATHVSPDWPPSVPPDVSLELRVLTGLQAGAALPLNQALRVGRADDCDLLLLDDQAPAHLLDIEPTQDGRLWLTPHLEGLMTESGQPLFESTEVAPGIAFGVDGLWLEVKASDDEWAPWVPPSERAQDPDALSADTNEALAEGADAALADGSLRTAPGSHQAVVDTEEVNFDDWMGAGLDPSELSSWAMNPSDRSPTPVAASVAPSVRSRRWQTWLVVATGGALTFCGVVAMVLQLGVVQGPEVPPPAAETARAASIGSSGRQDDADAPTPARSSGGDTQSAQAPARASAQASSRGTTAAAEPFMPGATAGVTIVRGATDVTLPFEVREVIFGARSRVVLSSGQVLVPGDAVGAWRLMEIRRGSLVFDGPQRVLLPW